MAWDKVNRTTSPVDTVDDISRKVNDLIDNVTQLRKLDNIDAKTANYTLVKDTDAVVTFDCSSSDLTATLPSVTTCSGQIFYIIKIDSTGLLTVDAGSGVLIDGDTRYLYMVQAYSVAILLSNGTKWFIIGPK